MRLRPREAGCRRFVLRRTRSELVRARVGEAGCQRDRTEKSLAWTTPVCLECQRFLTLATLNWRWVCGVPFSILMDAIRGDLSHQGVPGRKRKKPRGSPRGF